MSYADGEGQQHAERNESKNVADHQPEAARPRAKLEGAVDCLPHVQIQSVGEIHASPEREEHQERENGEVGEEQRDGGLTVHSAANDAATSRQVSGSKPLRASSAYAF